MSSCGSVVGGGGGRLYASPSLPLFTPLPHGPIPCTPCSSLPLSSLYPPPPPPSGCPAAGGPGCYTIPASRPPRGVLYFHLIIPKERRAQDFLSKNDVRNPICLGRAGEGVGGEKSRGGGGGRRNVERKSLGGGAIFGKIIGSSTIYIYLLHGRRWTHSVGRERDMLQPSRRWGQIARSTLR